MHFYMHSNLHKNFYSCKKWVLHVSLFFTSVSTPTLKYSHQTMIVGAHCGAHEIKLCESNDVSIYEQVSSRLKVISRVS
jgi:hypothetical protein